jgi:tetratricopeptide (TPR) repeat protein
MNKCSDSLKMIVIFYLCIGILILPIGKSGTFLFAQDIDCDKALIEAEQKYTEGRFDEAIAQITQCLDNSDVTEDQKQRAYRLMGLTYIAKDYLNEAKGAIEKLLLLVPNYKPDPIYDPPPFISLVEEVQSETIEALVVTTQAEEAVSDTASTGINKWWWIAGGAAVAVIGVVLISGGNGDDEQPEPTGFPGAPGRP